MEYGLLSIVVRDAQYEIELRANSDTVEYDGKEHSMTGFETNEFEIDGTRYTVTEVDSEAKGTEAGVYGTEVYGSAIVTDEEGNDVTDQFAVSYISGALTITKTGPDDEQNRKYQKRKLAVILIGSVLSIVFGRKKADDGNDSEEDEAAGKAK